MLFVNSVYNFSEMYLSYTLYLTAYFIKMALVGFQYEPVSLDVNEVCFEEAVDIPNTRENQGKVKACLNCADVENET